MATITAIDLGAYMSNSIRTIMAKAYKSVLSNPREAKFAYCMQTLFRKSEKRRKKMLEQEGLEVPPFLSCAPFLKTSSMLPQNHSLAAALWVLCIVAIRMLPTCKHYESSSANIKIKLKKHPQFT